MNTKFKKLVVAVILLAAVIGGVFLYRNLGQDKGAKEITIVIVNNKEKVIYKESVDTDAGTLEKLLKEMKKDGEIKLDYEDSAYGLYIKAMGKDELLKEDPTKGIYWTYNSKNNKSCVDAGYCDAANNVKIKDKEEFVFTLTKFEE